MKKFLGKCGKVIKSIFTFISRTLLFLMLIFITVGVLGLGFLGVKMLPVLEEAKSISYDKLLSIDGNTFMGLADTVIYDNKGEILSEINIGNYEYVTIDNLSHWVIDGYIAVEDQNFKTHNGIDYKGIARAAVSIIKNKGEITQGGSTITQQVIKNNLLTQEKSFKRKFIEFYLAPQIEKQYSKSQIMEFYVNTNFYGNNCEGIGIASKYYFGKEAKDLNIEESALLVGISNNPTFYNPKTKPENAREKRDFVLALMRDRGVITEEQYQKAVNTEITLVLERELREKENYQVSFAIHSATLKLMEIDGFEFKYTFKDKDDYDNYQNNYTEVYNEVAQKIRAGGYKIYTSLDTEKQVLLQGIVDNKLSSYKEKSEDGRYTMQGSATLINNETGYVEAIIGGRGTDDEFNRAFLSARQPGSSIKPIVVYGVAYDTGRYYPSLKKEDKYEKNGPKNWDLVYRGGVSLREALCRSINTVALNLFAEVGADKGLSYLDKLRFTDLTYMDNGNNALSLGGFTFGATTVDMAKAYSTIANYGEYLDNLCITKIEFQNKGIIFNGEINRTKVYEPDAAYMVLESLKSNMTKSYGLGRGLNVKNAVVGGKSGTTNSQKDVWFCGVSKYYSLAIWCGYDTPKSTGLYGSGIPGQIWNEAMTKLHEGMDKVDFEQPITITEQYINWKGEYVDYNSGVKDLYSQSLIDKAEVERQEKLEKERLEKELQEISIIEKEISKFKSYEVYGIESIEYVEAKYLEISNKIAKIVSEDKRKELQIDLDIVMANLEKDLKPFREQLKEKELEEIKKKQEKVEKSIISILLDLSNLKIISKAEINKALEYKSNIETLLNELNDQEKISKYKKQLNEVMKVKNSEIDAVRTQIEKDNMEKQNQQKTVLQGQLDLYLVVLNNFSIWTEEVESLYSKIEETLVQYEELGGSISYREAYLFKKEILDSTKE